MLDLNITTKEQVLKPVEVALTPKVAGAYMNFSENTMTIYVSFYDIDGVLVHNKDLTVKGDYYMGIVADIAPQVLGKIMTGVTQILSGDTTLQPSFDNGNIVIGDAH